MAIFDSMSTRASFNEVSNVLEGWLAKVYQVSLTVLNIRKVHVKVRKFLCLCVAGSLFLRSLSKLTPMTVVPLWYILSKPFSLMLQPIPSTFWYALFCNFIASLPHSSVTA